MAEAKKLGSAKRFGPRYGRTGKQKLAKIEEAQRGKHLCPYCHALKVKRLSAGIWICRGCNSKFTGKAYALKKIILKEEEASEGKEGKVVEEKEFVEKEEGAKEGTEEA